MKNRSIRSKIIAGLIMATMTISYTMVAFAENMVTDKSSTAQIVASATNISQSQGNSSNNDAQEGPNGGNTPPSIPGGEGSPDGQGGPGGQSASVMGTAVYTQDGDTVTQSDQDITATDQDESIIRVINGGNYTLSNSTLTKSGGDTSSEDSSNFYGVNAGVVAEAGSQINLEGSTITTSADGSNGVFATGEGATINVSNVTIKTTANSSRGLDATLKGTVNGKNVNITTEGIHCAGLATDRGNGTITVDGAAIVTNGTDSPGIYSTGTISAANADIKATASEAAVVEGKNSITLTDTNISGAKKNGVMLYQSFSGDAEVGTSSFTMTNGTLEAAAGALFYITNTDSIINLKNVDATEASGILLVANADRWGSTGANGGTVTLNGDKQLLTGNITADKLSSITVVLKNSSTLKSTINTANTAKAMSVSLDSSSIWDVTGTSYLTTLTDEDSSLSNIKDNGNTIYYDISASANSWLNGKTISLTGGGKLAPISK